MAANTKIEWTDASWTPIRARNIATGKIGWHCEKVSSGCDNCYSAKLNQQRFGTGLPFKPGHRKDIEIFLDEKMLLQPLKWKKPRRIFVCSMTDLFGDFHSDEWIDKMFAVMALCPQHTFQILTKRSKRMREYFMRLEGPKNSSVLIYQYGWCHAISVLGLRLTQMDIDYQGMQIKWPLPNVHLGVSCEDQTRADERIPDLLATPAAVRFVSAEPLLSGIKFSGLSEDKLEKWNWLTGESATMYYDGPDFEYGTKIDQIIVGGESGHGFRLMQLEWAEDIMRQCRETGTAFFFKQTSGPRAGMRGHASDELWSHKEFPHAER